MLWELTEVLSMRSLVTLDEEKRESVPHLVCPLRTLRNADRLTMPEKRTIMAAIRFCLFAFFSQITIHQIRNQQVSFNSLAKTNSSDVDQEVRYAHVGAQLSL